MTAADNDGVKLYHILTFGCQMNERDSEIMAGILQAEGYRPADTLENADIVLVNTCAVRESAERRIYGRIGQLKRLKYRNRDVIIGVGGCMAQQPEAAEAIRQRAPHVDVIFGTHNLHALPALLEEAGETADDRDIVTQVLDTPGQVVEGLPTVRKIPFKSFINITYGCNNFCTYCIVPYVRGRERSRMPADIVAEVKRLADDGVLDVTLLGQNVNSYGKDLDNGADFAALLEEVAAVKGIRWVRFTTSHPKDLSDRLIAVIANSDKICNHIHLPVQAGSDHTLQRMNRRYSKEQYLELVERIYDRIDGVSLTTDIMVGFPGETEDDFQHTLDVVRRARFDNAFTFMYSRRSGTPAADMPDQVPQEVKKGRLERLMELQHAISYEKNQLLAGKTMEVLVEGHAKKDPGRLLGRTETNKNVLFQGPEGLIGDFAVVTIEEAKTWTLEGRLLLEE